MARWTARLIAISRYVAAGVAATFVPAPIDAVPAVVLQNPYQPGKTTMTTRYLQTALLTAQALRLLDARCLPGFACYRPRQSS
ncbi:MAG: hypothetical protein AB7R89_25190 [Dehalococcoidia bacterium]